MTTEHYDALETRVAWSVASGAGAQFEQQASAFGEQAFEGDGLAEVFVLSATALPEGGLVVGAFVTANGGVGFRGHNSMKTG